MNPCPICEKPLLVFMRRPSNDIVCQCQNPECPMHPIETTGDKIQEALDRFAGKALRVQKGVKC